MLIPDYANRFERDLKRCLSRGKKADKIKQVIAMLVQQEALPTALKDHPLKGSWAGYRDCHIEPDWLLIYKIEDSIIRFERTGTHADLF